MNIYDIHVQERCSAIIEDTIEDINIQVCEHVRKTHPMSPLMCRVVFIKLLYIIYNGKNNATSLKIVVFCRCYLLRWCVSVSTSWPCMHVKVQRSTFPLLFYDSAEKAKVDKYTPNSNQVKGCHTHITMYIYVYKCRCSKWSLNIQPWFGYLLPVSLRCKGCHDGAKGHIIRMPRR